MNINTYLKHIQNNESIFPMDSPGKGVYKVKYPVEGGPVNEHPKKSEEENRIMIDFDGVISSYKHGWNNGELTDKPNPGAKEALDKLHNDGYEIVIFTTRASKEHNLNPSSFQLIEALEKWLNKYNIYYDRITSDKLGAVAYIDDRAIRFENWNQTLNDFKQLKNK
jgi:hypothetical protein